MRRTAQQLRAILAHNVKSLREQHQWTQTDLARHAGVPQTTISSVEKPDGKNPTTITLEQIADAFGVESWTLHIDANTSRVDDLRSVAKIVRTYMALPAHGRSEIDRVAEAEARYSGINRPDR